MLENGALLQLNDISKSFDDTHVLNGISLSVQEGEFVTILGPSGCGKTTILRIIAGLTEPDGGSLLLEGKDMRGVGPEKRSVNMVFQNYALFPHMNVYQNISYGLKIRSVSKDEIRDRVANALFLVRMSGFEKRMPSQLSGGQRQRIAIARAIINNPKILLLDEPLGALDLQLRREMQQELKHLQKELGMTFIYITHDQEEAINMSDRIVVMRNGQIEQEGTPAQIYDSPRTSFVARFVGAANILCGKVSAIGQDTLTLTASSGSMACTYHNPAPSPGERLAVAVRGENIRIRREASSPVHLAATILEKSFAGGMLRIITALDDGTQVVISRHGIYFDYGIGEKVCLEWDPHHAVIVNQEVAP